MSATPKNQDHHELIRQGYVADAMSQAAGKLRRFVPLGDGPRTTAGTGTGTATDVTV